MASGLPRLGGATLDRLPAGVRRPDWMRGATRIRTVHIGAGAFHRGHQADYAEDLLQGGWDAALVGINLKPPALRDLLGPQDGFYTRTLREGDGAETRLMGAIRGVVDAEANPGGALDWLSTPEVTTVTITVTEKGYCHVPATGALDMGHPDIQADLRGDLDRPRSLPGFLVAALRARRDEGGGPINLVSCDNLPGNGRILAGVVREMADATAPDLLPWIEDNLACPSTVVDRIVPALTPEDRDWLDRRLGLRDEAAVLAEPFRQWVIEDSFRAERPQWEAVGAQIVSDLSPQEALKMRVLNAAQTLLSLLGALAGHDFSHQAVRNPVLLGYVHGTILREVLPHLPDAVGGSSKDYLDQSLRRIGNTAIRHRCHQIATDTSRKIRQRLLDPLRARRAGGQPGPGLEAGVAAWVAYLAAGLPAHRDRWEPDDPVWARLAGSRNVDDLAQALLSSEDIFGSDLSRDEALRGRITARARGLLDGEFARVLGGG
ncbi:mannitol dehydrogenase family protein [Rubellimicrobium arenae]|uniref:mannitol dehydrogenase family protein n=1 Tax=Rubellimicrobium arenae TaxID=2817372 RepID=UPI001B315DF4|nr:mannitol dehydrogenase family protein [Rubellimicrobium arenae]